MTLPLQAHRTAHVKWQAMEVSDTVSIRKQSSARLTLPAQVCEKRLFIGGLPAKATEQV